MDLTLSHHPTWISRQRRAGWWRLSLFVLLCRGICVLPRLLRVLLPLSPQGLLSPCDSLEFFGSLHRIPVLAAILLRELLRLLAALALSALADHLSFRRISRVRP